MLSNQIKQNKAEKNQNVSCKHNALLILFCCVLDVFVSFFLCFCCLLCLNNEFDLIANKCNDNNDIGVSPDGFKNCNY